MFALQILARIGDRLGQWWPLPLLRHPDPNVAQAAVEALGRLRATAAVPALLELLQGICGYNWRRSPRWARSGTRPR